MMRHERLIVGERAVMSHEELIIGIRHDTVEKKCQGHKRECMAPERHGDGCGTSGKAS